ncbi:MAG: hypothetical protein DHS20C01_25490 [marine bacterium B5-7]|nr:MAG: hypothetical protein DHS20C01_25490 [marine bacterium B5-7]
MKKICCYLLTLILSTLSTVLWAIDVGLSPKVATATINISALVDLTRRSNIAGIDERTPLADVLDRLGIVPNTTLTPSSFNLSWTPVFQTQVNDYVFSSTAGNLVINGTTAGSQGPSLVSNCPVNAGSCATVSENLVLTPAIRQQIVRIALEGVTLGDALNRKISAKSVQLRFTRSFTTAIFSPQSATFEVAIGRRLNIDVDLAQSRIVDVTGKSRTTLLPVGTSASIPMSLDWTIRLQTLGSPPPLTVRSPMLEMRTLDGRVLGRISRALTTTLSRGLNRAKTLAETFPSQAARTSSEVLAEPVLIPASVAAKAHELGSRQVVLRRVFSDGFDSYTADIRVPIGTSSLADFQITRVDLRFNDGSRVKVIDGDIELNVVADINYLGSGQLHAVWEWAPVVAGGAPFFRPLPAGTVAPMDVLTDSFETRRTSTLVREFLNNLQRIRLLSPALPTVDEGGVLLRLRITRPDVLFELPVLRYYVLPSGARMGDNNNLPEITLLAPVGETPLGTRTEFRWLPVDGARAYRFECYANTEMTGGMITGAIVLADSDRLSPSELVMDHLEAGSGYWCRIVAIDKDGFLSAASMLLRMTAVK